MLVNQWADQYQETAGDTFARQVLATCQFFDFGADPGFTAGDDMFQTVRPPFPNVVAQFTTVGDIGGKRLLAIFLQVGVDQFTVCVASREEDREWWTTNAFPLEKNASGRWAVGRHPVANPTGDNRDIGLEAEKQLVSLVVSRLLSTFAVLACSNVLVRDVEAPAALNKKRAKKGKTPMVTYKILEVVAPPTRQERVDQGGTHAGPRVHLRRGHIRRLDEHRTTWVQPCVVGSEPGAVLKDYLVRQAGCHDAERAL